MLSLVTWCLMEYFQFVFLNRETFIANCFSAQTLPNKLIDYLMGFLYPNQGLLITVYCAKKCSPLKTNTKTVYIAVVILT